jgi:hypothetical protein
MTTLRLGERVQHAIDGRNALIIGKTEATGWNRALVLVAVEGSTRNEYWPLRHVVPRPKRDQVPALGGRFQPPKGFPLITSSDKP